MFLWKLIWPNIKMLYGDDMFLSATLMKLMVLKIGIIEQSRDFLVNLQFSGKSQCFYGSPYGIKEHKNDENVFVHIIIETRLTHKMCTTYI